MKYFLYLTAGAAFGLGLEISGMVNPLKVGHFLSIGYADWSPALLFTLGAAVTAYATLYLYLCRRGKYFNGSNFDRKAPLQIDRKLVMGSAMFGIGWGIAGMCPGPALVNALSLKPCFAVFIGAMLLGFELKRRFAGGT